MWVLGFVVVLVVVIAIVWGVFFTRASFYAVYLRTGDIYFGKLVRFPHFGLKQVYTIQVNQNNTQTPLSVQKFSNVFWGPSDYLQLNRDEVVWMTKLSHEGQLAKVLTDNPDLAPPVSQGSSQQQMAPQTQQQLEQQPEPESKKSNE